MTLRIKYRRRADLVPYAGNARTHTTKQVAQIAKSIEEFGWTNPILLDDDVGVIAGHGRLLAAELLGMDKVPTITLTGISDDHRRALVIADNQLALTAGWDADTLAAELQALAVSDFDLSTIGIPATELLALLARGKGKTDPDDIPPPAAEPAAVEGDVWTLGTHRIMCGDSTEEADIAKLMDGERADMVWTDPPYGVNVSGAGGDPIAGDISFTAIPLFFASLDSVLADNAWVYVCGGQSNLPLYSKMFEKYFRSLPKMIVWDKGRVAVMRANGYHSCYEFIYWAFKKGGGGRWFGPRDSDHADDIWRVSAPGNDREHVTEKPVELPKRAIGNSCPPGGLVYDPFAGAGGAIIAAETLGRRCYAMEIDPVYVDVAVRRWEEFTGGKATVEHGS